MHWCLNFVCEGVGVASAVLIRALEPTDGLDTMRARRGVADDRLLCAGPGRLCQALGITREHDGLPLDEPPFELLARESEPRAVRGPRIGITKAAEQPVALRPRGLALPQPPFPTMSRTSRPRAAATPARGFCASTRPGLPRANRTTRPFKLQLPQRRARMTAA